MSSQWLHFVKVAPRILTCCLYSYSDRGGFVIPAREPVRDAKAQGQHVTTSPAANSNSKHEKISRVTAGNTAELFPAAGMTDLKYKIQTQESCQEQSLLPATPNLPPCNWVLRRVRNLENSKNMITQMIME